MSKAVLCPVCNGKGCVEVSEFNPCYYPDYYPDYYKGSGYKFEVRCPACGQDRNASPLTGCPNGSHYGTYCEA